MKLDSKGAESWGPVLLNRTERAVTWWDLDGGRFGFSRGFVFFGINIQQRRSYLCVLMISIPSNFPFSVLSWLNSSYNVSAHCNGYSYNRFLTFQHMLTKTKRTVAGNWCLTFQAHCSRTRNLTTRHPSTRGILGAETSSEGFNANTNEID